jgi:hypothetical protein
VGDGAAVPNSSPDRRLPPVVLASKGGASENKGVGAVDEKTFKERVARLQKVGEIVEKLPPEVRAQAFATLEPYVTGEAATPTRGKRTTKPDGGAGGDSDDNDESREEFFKRHDHDKPSDNVRLIAAYHFQQHGSAPFTVDELKEIADDVGITVPDRIYMTLRAAQADGKKLFSSPSRGLFKPTVHGEANLKTTYEVKKGNKPKAVKPEAAE